MRAIIQSIAQETQVRDRQGQVVTTIRGRVFTLILRLLLVGLFLLSISGVLGFLIMWAMGDIDPNNAHFGYMEG